MPRGLSAHRGLISRVLSRRPRAKTLRRLQLCDLKPLSWLERLPWALRLPRWQGLGLPPLPRGRAGGEAPNPRSLKEICRNRRAATSTSALGRQRAHSPNSWRPPPTHLVGHRVLVGVPLLAALVLVHRGHDLQDVVVGGQGCGKQGRMKQGMGTPGGQLFLSFSPAGGSPQCYHQGPLLIPPGCQGPESPPIRRRSPELDIMLKLCAGRSGTRL